MHNRPIHAIGFTGSGQGFWVPDEMMQRSSEACRHSANQSVVSVLHDGPRHGDASVKQSTQVQTQETQDAPRNMSTELPVPRG